MIATFFILSHTAIYMRRVKNGDGEVIEFFLLNETFFFCVNSIQFEGMLDV